MVMYLKEWTYDSDAPLSTISVDVNMIGMTASEIEAMGFVIPAGSL